MFYSIHVCLHYSTTIPLSESTSSQWKALEIARTNRNISILFDQCLFTTLSMDATSKSREYSIDIITAEEKKEWLVKEKKKGGDERNFILLCVIIKDF